MLKVLIANDLKTYVQGKSDGLIFSDVANEDIKTLKKLAETYNKQIKIIEMQDAVESISSEEPKDLNSDKRKIKKIFVTNGKETIKITPDKLPEYRQKGYVQGRKKKG